jgi:hypothetical protein
MKKYERGTSPLEIRKMKFEAHKRRGEARTIIFVATEKRPALRTLMNSVKRPVEVVPDDVRRKRVRFVAELRDQIIAAYGEPLKQFWLPGTISQVLLETLFPETEEEGESRKDIYG